jgi:hypothetical protein
MAKGELVVIPLLSGSEKDVETVLINAPFQIKDSSTYKYPHPDFGFWLVTEIFEKQKIMAKTAGFFKKKFVCSSCQTELDPEKQIREAIDLELKFKGLDPFQLKIIMPFVKCAHCQKKNVVDVKGVYGFRIPEALLHALQAGNIKPS